MALFISVTLPLLSTFPATLATDVNVPAVSKKSINNNPWIVFPYELRELVSIDDLRKELK